MIHNWIPLKGVGLLKFGTSIDQFVQDGTAVFIDTSDSTGWSTYAYDNESLRINVERGKIVSIACYEQCLLNETDLIGLDFELIERILGCATEVNPDVLLINEDPQEVFEFDNVGAQVWVKNGRVVTVICDDGN